MQIVSDNNPRRSYVKSKGIHKYIFEAITTNSSRPVVVQKTDEGPMPVHKSSRFWALIAHHLVSFRVRIKNSGR